MSRIRIALAALAIVAAAPTSQAGFFLTFDQTIYTVAAGGTVSLNVSLQWAPDVSSRSADPLATLGLISGGVGLRSASAGLFALADPLADIDGNPLFDALTTYDAQSGPPFTGTGLIAGLSEGALFNPAVAAANPGAPVFLGTFRLRGASAGTAIITAGRLDPLGGSEYLTLSDGTALDGVTSFGTAEVTVTGADGVQPVPAPMSAALLAGSACLLAARRFRRGARTA